MSSYVFIFHQLADVLEELPAYVNKNRVDNTKYILAYYRSRIDGFNISITMQGISTVHNTEKHWRNLVRANAEQVTNRITANEQKGFMAIEEEDDDIDSNNEDEDEDNDIDDE